MVRPSRSSRDPVAVGHADARGRAVPGEDDVGRRVDRGRGREARHRAPRHDRRVELELLDDVGDPAFAEALPGEHRHRPGAEQAPQRHLDRAGVGGGDDADAVAGGHAQDMPGQVDRMASRALPSFERCERPSEPMASFREPSPAAWRRDRKRNRGVRGGSGFRRAACRRRRSFSHCQTLLAESTRRVGTAWPAGGPRGRADSCQPARSAPARARLTFRPLRLDHRLAPAAESTGAVGNSLGGVAPVDGLHPAERPAGAPPRPSRGTLAAGGPGRFAEPGHAAMPYRSRPRTDRLSGARRPPFRARLLGARRGPAARDRHAGDQSRRDDLSARPPVRPLGREAVQTAASQWLGSPVRRIETFGTYACRARQQPARRAAQRAWPTPMRSTSPASSSPTAAAITVQDGWNGEDERVRRFLRAVHQAGCRRFDIGLGPTPTPITTTTCISTWVAALIAARSLTRYDLILFPPSASSSLRARRPRPPPRRPKARRPSATPIASPSRTWTSCCARICGRSASSSSC